MVVGSAGLVASIAGGDRDVGLLTPWSLSASSSIDLDASSEDQDQITYAASLLPPCTLRTLPPSLSVVARSLHHPCLFGWYGVGWSAVALWSGLQFGLHISAHFDIFLGLTKHCRFSLGS